MLKADGPAVRILWSIDCNDACVTAAVRTGRKRQKSTVVSSSVEPMNALDFEFIYFLSHSPSLILAISTLVLLSCRAV